MTDWHFSHNIFTCDSGEFAHLWGDVSVVSSQKGDKALLHYLIIQPTRDSFSLSSHFLSVCYPPLFLTHPLPSNSLGGSQGSNWQASRETERKRNCKSERARERQWYMKKRAWHQSTYFSLFAMFPIFAFLPPPLPFFAASSACLAF